MVIGAKLAAPEQQVVAMAGDMGMACNITRLETCIRENLNVVTIVFNDHGLGNEKALQDERHGGHHFGVDYTETDFTDIARAFGVHGEHMERVPEFGPALQRSLVAHELADID